MLSAKAGGPNAIDLLVGKTIKGIDIAMRQGDVTLHLWFEDETDCEISARSAPKVDLVVSQAGSAETRRAECWVAPI